MYDIHEYAMDKAKKIMKAKILESVFFVAKMKIKKISMKIENRHAIFIMKSQSFFCSLFIIGYLFKVNHKYSIGINILISLFFNRIKVEE